MDVNIGTNALAILELPRRDNGHMLGGRSAAGVGSGGGSGGAGGGGGGGNGMTGGEVSCRLVKVGDPFFLTHDYVTIVEAVWHPSSHHIVILTDDDAVRMYNVTDDVESPELVLPLSVGALDEVGRKQVLLGTPLRLRWMINRGAVVVAWLALLLASGVGRVCLWWWPGWL